jgi:hypothetical protein
VSLVLDWVWNKVAFAIQVKLGSVDLGPSLVDKDAIGQVRDVKAIRLAASGFPSKEQEALFLEAHIVVRMLDKQPGGLSALLSHHCDRGPAVQPDDCLDSGRVCPVNLYERFATSTCRLVHPGQLEEFGPQYVIHRTGK